MKSIILLALLVILGCSKEEVDILKGVDGNQGPVGSSGSTGPAGVDGKDGKDGSQGEAGPQGEQGATGPQGEQGLAGNDGQDGQDGEDGSAAVSIDSYSSSSCTSIGSGKYYKSSGANAKIYTNSSCSGSSYAELNAAQSTVWLSSSILAIYEEVGKLKILTF